MQYVMPIVFLLAALVTYAKGVRMEKPGSYPLMIIFVLGAAVGRFTPLHSIIAVAFALAALWVYRKSIGIAKSIATVLAIFAVLTAVMPHTPIPERIGERMEERREESARERRRAEREHYRYVHFEMLGEKLAPRLSPGANVLLLSRTLGDSVFEEMVETERIEEGTTIEEWRESARGELEAMAKEHFEKGAGFSINVVGSTGVGRQSGAREFNEAIEPYRGEIALVLSDQQFPYSDRAGLIYSLEDLDFHNWSEAPEFAVYIRSLRYNAEMLRDYMRDGLLSAVVLPAERASRDIPLHETLVPVGPDNIEKLPEESPR